jgi:hypothetical protein
MRTLLRDLAGSLARHLTGDLVRSLTGVRTRSLTRSFTRVSLGRFSGNSHFFLYYQDKKNKK